MCRIYILSSVPSDANLWSSMLPYLFVYDPKDDPRNLGRDNGWQIYSMGSHERSTSFYPEARLSIYDPKKSRLIWWWEESNPRDWGLWWGSYHDVNDVDPWEKSIEVIRLWTPGGASVSTIRRKMKESLCHIAENQILLSCLPREFRSDRCRSSVRENWKRAIEKEANSFCGSQGEKRPWDRTRPRSRRSSPLQQPGGNPLRNHRQWKVFILMEKERQSKKFSISD